MSDDDNWYEVRVGTDEEARGDYDHDVAKQAELDDTQTTLGELK